ncbi:unnamed protein product [Musa acuminata subsp. malaccensis]|uniref:(wild Malaysian banana) hypothetical protein n=1 Tax=Musa acuminata subsp. malaccensis TaxID=214687 RepID=A0A804I9V3_MUSAM|nr:unnamed protein product [Musa acuminata subsp. malaccensis]
MLTVGSPWVVMLQGRRCRPAGKALVLSPRRSPPLLRLE